MIPEVRRPVAGGHQLVISIRGLLLALAATGLLTSRAAAYPLSTTFNINSAQSPLTINAEATVIFTFMDSDTQEVEGTLDATIDFGSSGAFPNSATVNLTSSAVTHDTPFVLDLATAHTVITGLVADASTINPPAPLTRDLVAPGTVYNFDASDFLITLVDGDVVITGFVEEMRDLSEQDPPVSGSAPAGTTGTVTFAVQSTSGPYSLVNATLLFPVDIADTIPVGDIDVDIELIGDVVAQASFYVALAGVPGDFDEDGDVDDDDLPLWEAGFGMTAGAGPGNGNADGDTDVDGADFLIWQRNVGTAPPPLIAAVPEPATSGLIAVGAMVTSLLGLRRRRIAKL